MTILDGVLLLILFLFIATGLRLGLIHTLGALVGTIVGVLVAGNYFEAGAGLIDGVLLGSSRGSIALPSDLDIFFPSEVKKPLARSELYLSFSREVEKSPSSPKGISLSKK